MKKNIIYACLSMLFMLAMSPALPIVKAAPAPICQMEKSLDEEVVAAVLQAAAEASGISVESLRDEYDSGDLTIEQLTEDSYLVQSVTTGGLVVFVEEII